MKTLAGPGTTNLISYKYQGLKSIVGGRKFKYMIFNMQYVCSALQPLKVTAIAYILHKNSDSSVERPFESGADIYQLDISFNEANTNVSPLCPDTLSATSQAQTIDTATISREHGWEVTAS